jgi:transcriptional regulator with XRE-family HTH domain
MSLNNAPNKVNSVRTCEQPVNSLFEVNALSFGRRLREERDRLGLSQSALAEVGGIKRTTQHIYETDIRGPDLQYLDRIKDAGVDIAYLVLGERIPLGRADILNISYSAITNIYRVVDEFCVDDDGLRLPLDSRVRFFQLLCASLKGRGSNDADLNSLRTELAKFNSR